VEHPIRVIGIGPGNPEHITPAAFNLIRTSDVLVGGERALRNFTFLGKESFTVRNNLAEMVDFIKKRRQNRITAVLASGDPAFYGILEYLKRHFPKSELLVEPGLSSIQLACARLAVSWHDAAFYSVHGRDAAGLVDLVKHFPKVIVLTGPDSTPAVIAERLLGAGITDRRIYVCENLSYEDERIGAYGINEVPENIGLAGCVMVINNE